MLGQGMLSGIGRRVSSLFGILSQPASDTVRRAGGSSAPSTPRRRVPHLFQQTRRVFALIAAPQRAVGGRGQLPVHADQLQSE